MLGLCTVIQMPVFGQGLLTTIRPTLETGPQLHYSEIVTRHDLPELLANVTDPSAPMLKGDIRFDKEYWAKDVRFSQEKWMLEFSFKPMRMIWVDLPNNEGTLDRKLVWYLVYSVKNTGQAVRSRLKTPYTVDSEIMKETKIALSQLEVPGVDLGNVHVKGTRTENESDKMLLIETLESPNRNDEGEYVNEEIAIPIRFVPRFVLTAERIVADSQSRIDPETQAVKSDIQTISVAYNDKVMPLALGAIKERERLALLNSVSIAKNEIAPGETLWGVTTWVDVDPRIDKFSVFVSGLTNSYRWTDKAQGEEGAYKKGDPIGTGREMARKTLKLNFWRPGDEFDQNEKEIRLGQPGTVDYEWVFR